MTPVWGSATVTEAELSWVPPWAPGPETVSR